MPPTWYLSVEWQMFLLAPILIFPAWKLGRKLLFLALPALVVASSYFAYQTSMENGLLLKDLEL
jgi:peptidoglycan/LPS O-acetylase OafA/YrhL